MSHQLADFTPADGERVDQIALAAFRQYQNEYEDWPVFAGRVGAMAALAESAELIVAKVGGDIAGAVAYVAPGRKKAPFFAADWSILRMLVVEPSFRGLGIGRALVLECIRRARRDEAACIALHTSPIMKVALSMYERMGFRFEREVAPIHGVPYGVYVLVLS